MRLFGFEITRTKATNVTSVHSAGGGGWLNIIREPWGGAWQANVSVDTPKEILAFSATYACTTLIAADVGKLKVKITREAPGGVFEDVIGSPFSQVFKRPNHFQSWIKFAEQWVVSKLLFGNSYALKQRDQRGMVKALYLLDAKRVTALVAEDGSVFYQLSSDDLAGVGEAVTVPASEIIHDMMVALWHPLVGISPLYACAQAATQGNRIQANSTKFFDNMSRPSGILTAPGTISDEVAKRLVDEWHEKYSGQNVGRVAVLGDGLKYEGMHIPAEQAQLIEQQKWTVEDVARAFHVPMYKIGGPVPAGSSVEALAQCYYNDCLQSILESFEAALDYGLGLPAGYRTEFDLAGLVRMDTAARFQAKNLAVGGGWMAPNEARIGENLPPVPGGESPMIQQQNYSLQALARRDAREDPFAPLTAPAPQIESGDDEQAQAEADAEAEARTLLETIQKGLVYERV